MKAKILYFDTESTCKIVTRKVKDGEISIKKKTWIVDKLKKPILISVGRVFKKPMRLYFLKHDLSNPLEYDFEKQAFKQSVSPENYSELTKQGAIQQLLTLKGTQTADILIWIIIGAAMGFFAGGFFGPSIISGFG